MKWLLDTNVVSEGVRKSPSHSVLKWIAAQPPVDLAISVVTIAELRDGLASARNPIRFQELSHWLSTEIPGTFKDRTLAVTSDILIDWLQLARGLRGSGKTRDPADLLIASTARIQRLAVVTRNTRDFASTGVTVYNPWTDETHIMEAP